MKIALSSCWNSHRHEDGYKMVTEMADLGFAHIELSHGIRIGLVPGILKALEEGIVQVASVHNFCPLPTGVMGAAPNLYEPTARGKQEQDLWFRHTLKTLDFGARVGADLMVIHSGSMRFALRDYDKKLDGLLEAAEGGDEKADTTKAKAKAAAFVEKSLAKFRKRMKAPRHRLIENFKRIAEPARERGIRVAIENREGFVELPLDEDMPLLLQDLEEPDVFGYWHDSGHAQLKERMGIVKHTSLLEGNRARQFGFHLHDVSEEGRDHQPLGSGVIDWETVASFFRDDDLLVVEMSPRQRSSSIAESRDFLQKLLAAKTA
ncbi:MAG: sugar phosphate isomerase/epimerase [Opitutales bacterium]|nr:sugar phosphate isomerase/epimerase [Opitutales bacterium]